MTISVDLIRKIKHLEEVRCGNRIYGSNPHAPLHSIRFDTTTQNATMITGINLNKLANFLIQQFVPSFTEIYGELKIRIHNEKFTSRTLFLKTCISETTD